LGCATGSAYLKDYRRDVEHAKQAVEENFAYPYKEVFFAVAQVLNDMGVAIYVKDFDNGVILAMGTTQGAYYVTPSTNFGFWLNRTDTKNTKVTLRIAGTKWLPGASPQDVFNMIKKELELRDKEK
jgi:hypothetical protein